MRRRVEEHVPVKDADRQLKLGVGGLRDVEFSVQLLQLVHGRHEHLGHVLPAIASETAGFDIGVHRQDFLSYVLQNAKRRGRRGPRRQVCRRTKAVGDTSAPTAACPV